MRAMWFGLVMAAVTSVLLVRGSVQAGEEKIPLDKLPKPVLEAVKKRFPKAELVAAIKETVDKKTEYEVVLKNQGQKIDMTLTPEGAILQMEKEITAKDLPKAVTKSLKMSYPKAVYKRVEEFIKVKDGKETLAFYEVLLDTADKKTVEVKIEANGKIISPAAKEGGKKEARKDAGKQATNKSYFDRASLTASNRNPHFSLKPESERPV